MTPQEPPSFSTAGAPSGNAWGPVVVGPSNHPSDATTEATVPSPAAASVVVFDTLEQAQSLWSSFENQADGYVFQQFNWVSSWHHFFGEASGLQPCIAAVLNPAGQPLMLLPLGVQRRRGVRRLIWLGGVLSDYHGPLLARDCHHAITRDNFGELWSRIRAALPPHDLVHFEKQPEYIVDQPNPFCYLPVSPNASSAHSMLLGQNYQDFLQHKRSKRWTQGERRKERRLESMGRVAFSVVREPDEIVRRLEDLMEQKSRRYRELGARDLLADARLRAFLQFMSTTHITPGIVHLSVLTLDGRTIAAHWGLLHRARFYHLLPTYVRDDTTRCSPGNIILRRLLQWTIENGVREYDFTLGDEPYKFDWCDRQLLLFDLLQPVTWRGRSAALPGQANRWARRRLRKWPAAWNVAKGLKHQTVRVGRALLNAVGAAQQDRERPS